MKLELSYLYEACDVRGRRYTLCPAGQLTGLSKRDKAQNALDRNLIRKVFRKVFHAGKPQHQPQLQLQPESELLTLAY